MEQGKQDYKQIPQQKYPTMTTDQHLNVITLFSGYDSQCLALNRLGIPYDLAAWCEIDRHAITAHNALFPQWKDRNLGDVSRVDWAEWHSRHPQPIDLLTYSSPCQDFSSAGLQRGGEEGSGTRSGLLWETERAVRELRPRHLVFENVGGLVSDKFIDLFNRWQARLNTYGYTNFQQLMNAKDYGVPQNRLRIFMVSILDCQRAYYFPKPFKLERRLKDVLEQNVEERYYLKEESVRRLFAANDEMAAKGNGFAFKPSMPPHDDIATALMVTHGWRRDDTFVAEPQIASMKSRDRDNPTGVRTANNGNFAQRLEPSADQSTSNTITSVAKDNLLIEPRSKRQESIKAKVMPNGDIRCYRDIPGKPGVSELQFTHPDNESPTVTCEAQIKVIEPAIIEDFYGTVREPRVYTDEAPTLRADRTGLMTIEHASVAKDNYLIVPEATKEGYAVVPEGGVFDASYPDSKTRRGRVQEGGTVSPTIMAGQNELLRYEGIRIRRLTERDNNKKNINNGQTRVFTEINEANTREVLRILWQEVGAQPSLSAQCECWCAWYFGGRRGAYSQLCCC